VTVLLRHASSADLDQVVTVFLGCWTQSYRGVLPDRDIDGWDTERARAFWLAKLDDGSRVTVVEVDGVVSGLVRFEAEGALGHVHSLYVDPASAGLGLGRLLMDSAISDLVEAGCDRVTLWVFVANTAAQAFYRRLDFADDGRRTREAEFVSELMGMTKALAPEGGQ
jgi:ribosomal protein S18 acetylase RimI-like enzyme